MGIEAALIGGGLGLLGSSMAGNSAEDAARTSAAAQTEAARVAAEAQKFRPVGVTSRFGSSQFTMSPEGYLQSAGYNVAPDIAALREQFLSQAGGAGAGLTAQGLQGAQSLFNLGQQYLAESPEQAAQKYMANQQALLAPSRQQAQAGLTQNLFNTGRGGVAVSQGGMLGAANPEQQALLNAQAMQDLQLAAQAQQAGQQQTQFGAGLFGLGSQAATAGYAPVQTQVGLASTLEQLGQSPLDIGAQLGGRAATAGANVGQTLLAGGLGAAKTAQQANAYNPVGTGLAGLGSNQQFTSALANLFKPANTGFGTGSAFGNQDYGLYL
jgi:hypothetical protein